jgi:hypothetical protein
VNRDPQRDEYQPAPASSGGPCASPVTVGNEPIEPTQGQQQSAIAQQRLKIDGVEILEHELAGDD